jgi:hypothetical protein
MSAERRIHDDGITRAQAKTNYTGLDRGVSLQRSYPYDILPLSLQETSR